jgi:pyruvate/2-oxoglutarate dehydrogenase complex dihydrolipoamide dehydrogenase (E3) component
MSEVLTPDLCVIGAGSGGLSVAAGAVQMGASVVLIEGHKMGGDCLNYGCVPSKALIAAGKAAQAHRTSARFGVTANEPEIDYGVAMNHVHNVIKGIEPHDSVERFEGLGVTVLQDWATFTGPDEVHAAGKTIRPRRFVISTGSSPVLPPIEGLADTPHLTNETLWKNRERPDRLLIIGGGPIGLEMAQAHRRLGSEVVVFEAFKALGKDDPEMTAILLDKLRAEGIEIREGAKIARTRGEDGKPVITLEDGEEIHGTHLLVAAGRVANVDKLNLDKAGVEFDRRGVTVDKGLRSVSNRKIYAIGDVAGGLQFTHVAGYQAGLVIRNALFRLPVKNRTDLIPWVTYTDPELANVGLGEATAREEHGENIDVARFEFAENDRARAELKTYGKAKAVIGKRGKILGCSIVGPQAGELIQPWALAVSKGMKIGDMAGHVAAYPTLGEVSKRTAGTYYIPRLFESDRVKWIVRLLARLG